MHNTARYILCRLFLFSSTFQVLAQEIAPEVTLEKQRLLILPVDSLEAKESIAAAVTSIVASEATKLKRFEVIDRTRMQQILDEQALQMSGLIKDSDIVEMGALAGADEALIVEITNFGQKGVPPEEDKDDDDDDDASLFDWVVAVTDLVNAVNAISKKSAEDEPYPNNIRTTLQGEIRKINLETGQSIDAFSINADHTGGPRASSLNHVLDRVRGQIAWELQDLFILTSEVLDVRGNELTLLLGSEFGLKKGTIFEITARDQVRTVGDREVIIPGNRVGLVEIVDLSSDANRSRILRHWEPIEPGYKAVEFHKSIFAYGLDIGVGTDVPNYMFRLSGFVNPLDQFDLKADLALGLLQDSRDDMDFHFRLGGSFLYRLILTSPFTAGPYIDFPFDIALRWDDEDHLVTLPIFSPRIGLQSTIMLSPNRDLVVRVETVLADLHARKWKYTVSEGDDDDDTVIYDAVWDGPAPDIRVQGIYLSIGMKFYGF